MLVGIACTVLKITGGSVFTGLTDQLHSNISFLFGLKIQIKAQGGWHEFQSANQQLC